MIEHSRVRLWMESPLVVLRIASAVGVIGLAFLAVAMVPPGVHGQSAPACVATWPRPDINTGSDSNRTAARDSLRRAARAAPNDGERWLAYGLFLTLTAGEQPGEWRARVEAEKALERAFDLLARDPRPIAALAVLRRKQGARMDARRMIGRAVRMVTDGSHGLGPCFEAELYYQMAMIHRAWWNDWDGMTYMGGSIGSFRPCPKEVVTLDQEGQAQKFCGHTYYHIMDQRANLSSMRHDDRDAVIESLEAALHANPQHREARRALLLALFELPDAARFAQIIRTGLATDSTDPWIYLWGAAEAFSRRAFDPSIHFLNRALPFLADDQRALLLSPRRLVPPTIADRWQPGDDSTYWRIADPLFLTDENERLLAHVARVTYAATKFEVPLEATMGLDTDAGNLAVRYGQPWRRWLTAVEIGNLYGARELIWAVDSLTPPHILLRPLTTQRWRLSEASAATLQANLARMPQRWNPAEAFDAFDSLGVQAVRFEDAGHTVLDVYALWRNPYPDFVPDTIRVGFFVHDDMMRPLVDRRRTVRGRADPLPLRFRAPLGPAVYWYGVESLTGPHRAAARARGGLRVVAAPADSLRSSDLLLGRASRAPPPVIAHRDSLRIDPLYDLELGVADSLVVYWETYGLRPDSAGTVRYRVSLETREAGRGAVSGLIARLGAAVGLGRANGLTVEWEVAAPAPDGVRRDVLAIDPAQWPAGSYRITVRILEPSTGRSTVAQQTVARLEL